MSVKILLVDEITLASEGLVRIISSEKNFTIQQISGSVQVLEYTKKNKVQIVIIGVNQNQNGLLMMEKIKKINPRIKVIGFSLTGNYHNIQLLLEQGGDGFILNNTTSEELIYILKHLLNDKTFLTTEVQQILLKGMRENKNVQPLTNKEIEVLQLIAKGFTNKMIAGKLNVGEETIKSHRKNIMSKLNIHKAAELVRYAIEKGMT